MSQGITSRLFRGLFPKKRFSSGSTDHPTPVDLFRAILEKLVRENRWDWVNFDTPGSLGWIQVALSDETFALNFSYTFDDDPVERLTGSGIDIPTQWTIEFFEARKAATLAVPTCDVQELATVVDDIFRSMFGCAPSYVATAVLE